MRRLSGFSLMEMMIVLTIVAIVAAASAPMVNKKMVVSSSNDNIWQWDAARHSTYFNDDNANNSTKSVRIGSRNLPLSSMNPRLYIRNRAGIPHMEFTSQGSNFITKLWAGNDRNIWLTTNNPDNSTDSSVVIGFNSLATAEGVSVGTDIRDISYSTGAVLIGQDAGALAAEDSVAIGKSARVGTNSSNSLGSIAIGSIAHAYNARSIAIGRTAQADNDYAIAIGSATNDSNSVAQRTCAQGDSSIALGAVARVDTDSDSSIAIGSPSTINRNTPNSIAIGANSTISESSDNSIAIGSDSTVHRLSKNSIVIGNGAQTPNGTSKSVIAIGTNAGSSQNYGANNLIAIGENAGKYVRAANKICIGNDAGPRINSPISERSSTDEIIYIGSRPKWTPHVWTEWGGNGDWFQDGMIVIHNNTTTASPGKRRHANEKGPTVYINGNLCVRGYIAGVMRNDDSNENERMAIIGSKGMGNKDGMNMFTGDHFSHQNMSDRRLKNVGKVFVGGLAELKKLDLYNYTFKDDKDKTPRVGVMAQDLQKIFPQAVTKDDNGILAIRTEDIFYALVNTAKELDLRIFSNSKKIEALEKQNAELLKRIEALEKTKK